ncbi:hypothetical protein ACLBWP_10490 [Microbacterium sp. M1A1_1b]|uniref:hypothetical protein n=1 Tax=Curtobacterium sp. VKM Ac-2922 TaxID=2929475 RepID=UPI001FB2DC4B|nr:hypothetical protein [Curtobacterium sp. VKM Ac-2922]MCJ1715130.1 hypothetical protein [Curtobacterium sp. VKM Ac-2922]
MRSTYLGVQRNTRIAGSHPRVGLTAPDVIDAWVSARIEDPSLLSRRTEPSYADFFSVPRS